MNVKRSKKVKISQIGTNNDLLIKRELNKKQLQYDESNLNY
jgi:hypothetical protein